MTTRVHHLVQTNSEVCCLYWFHVCKKGVFMPDDDDDDDDVLESRIVDPHLMDVSVDSSVFVCVRCFKEL